MIKLPHSTQTNPPEAREYGAEAKLCPFRGGISLRRQKSAEY